ncbi:MAG: hypothetical protein IPG17_29645 [Sandaracinaceae bacterium]|nr:hypothetical protein [Sandaracinaceae bacterium]
MNAWTRFGFVALCGVLGVGCLSETRYVCPPGSDVTASTRCGVACASGELSASVCDEVRAACADGRLTAIDCAGIDGDLGVQDMGTDQADVGPDMDVTADTGVDQGPCGACGVDAPLCNTATMQCVECLGVGDCGGDTPQCNAAGECVECLSGAHCSGDTLVCSNGRCVGCEDAGDCTAAEPVCQPAGQTCGNCVDRADCLNYPTLPSCNLGTGACVACDEENESADCGEGSPTPRCSASRQCVQCRVNTSNLDCRSTTASQCVSNSCASCTTNAHCAHLTNTPYCFNSACRACTPTSEDDDCNGNTCNPVTRACTNTAIGSQGVCESCVSDSDCSQADGTSRCIRMNYMGTLRGGYCLLQGPTCDRPFGVFINQQSLSGAAATNYCGIDQSAVSCEAVRALQVSRTCPSGNANECMADGALCAMVGGLSNRCTYPCSSPDECLPTGPASSCGAGRCGS